MGKFTFYVGGGRRRREWHKRIREAIQKHNGDASQVGSPRGIESPLPGGVVATPPPNPSAARRLPPHYGMKTNGHQDRS